jgi:acetolactate synthase-1/2/3 large subunit
MGLGAFPGDDPQFVGMLGMHGTYEANMTMHNADVILAIGARFDDRVTNNPAKFCPNAKVIHIDIDPATISKRLWRIFRSWVRLNLSSRNVGSVETNECV